MDEPEQQPKKLSNEKLAEIAREDNAKNDPRRKNPQLETAGGNISTDELMRKPTGW